MAHMLKSQEIFNLVAKHLLKQGKRSEANIEHKTDFKSSAYRGDDQCKCAIGILLPDDVYKPDMEISSVYALFEQYPSGMRASRLSRRNLQLLTDLQDIHDVAESADWRPALKKLARKRRLTDQVIAA